MQARSVIGVDLGGTSVRAAVIGLDGTLLSKTHKSPSCAEQGPEATVSSVIAVCREAMDEGGQVSAVGLAIPGHVDDANGVVKWSPNFGVRREGVLEYWKNVQVKKPLESALSLPVCMANDANAAAIGEYRFGSGKGSANCLVLLTLGTGIGGGVVFGPGSTGGGGTRPVLLLGGNKGGAELGHTVIHREGLDSSSGAYGTVEAYCQRDSIVRRAQNKLVRGRRSIVADLAGGDIGKITPEAIGRAADEGDELALEVWREVGSFLGTAIGSLINVFAPDVFAVGGQVALAGEHLLGHAREEAARVAIPSLFADCRIVQAERIKDAGVIGAASLALEAE